MEDKRQGGERGKWILKRNIAKKQTHSPPPTPQYSVQRQLRVGVDGDDRFLPLLPDCQVPLGWVGGQSPNAPSPNGTEVGLLQGGDMKQLKEVAGGKGHHVFPKDHQVAALQTLIAK